MLFTTTYRPTTIEQFVGNGFLVTPFTQWLQQPSSCALVSGICGVGKSLFVELMLAQNHCNCLQLNYSDRETMQTVIKPFTRTINAVTGQRNVLVVNDVDSGTIDIAGLVECIKQSCIPIVCICDNRYHTSLKALLPLCVEFQMTKPSVSEMLPFVRHVAASEHLTVSESHLRDLVERSNGDIRFVLNTLQFGLTSATGDKHIQSANVFETSAQLLSMEESLETKYDTFGLAHDLHPLMVQENYIDHTLSARDELRKLDNVAFAAEAISDMDLFSAVLEPMVAISAIRAASKCNKKGPLQFPQLLRRHRREKVNFEQARFLQPDKKEKVVKEKKEKVVKEKKQKVVKEKKEKVVKEKKKVDDETTTAKVAEKKRKKTEG